MSGKPSADLQPIVPRAAWDEAIGRMLRAFVGRGKRFTSPDKLEGPSGIAARRIEAARCYLGDPEHRPLDGPAALSIAGVLGPEALTYLAELIQMLAVWQPDADDSDPATLGADEVDDAATVNRLTRDNNLSPDDAKRLRPVGVRMMQRGARLAYGRAA